MFSVSFNWQRMVIKLALTLALVLPVESFATVARMHTVKGIVDVQLYDAATPLTVANFLRYVRAGAYNSSFFHRSVPGFVIQGGGYTFDTALHSVTTYPPVLNEFSPTRSNLRGTIAMAKLGGNANSATSQWFFNLANNSANLDNQNGGFTVFGKVLGAGMTVVDAIAALPIANAGGNFTALPYVPPITNNTLQKSNLALVNKVSLSTPTLTRTEDRIFNYLEAVYPTRFAPANLLNPTVAVSRTSGSYYYRSYATSKRYVAVKGSAVYWGTSLSSTNLTVIGTVSRLLATASALGY
jgi:cyclophilin family peptidyl-prolyl cis-trans isomerase